MLVALQSICSVLGSQETAVLRGGHDSETLPPESTGRGHCSLALGLSYSPLSSCHHLLRFDPIQQLAERTQLQRCIAHRFFHIRVGGCTPCWVLAARPKSDLFICHVLACGIAMTISTVEGLAHLARRVQLLSPSRRVQKSWVPEDVVAFLRR